MLGKLLKYELRATARKLLPLYGALIGISLILNLQLLISGESYMSSNNDMMGMGIFESITMFLYVGIIVAIAVMTLLIIIQRFQKNLLGDEGYLMFTLPVSVWKNIGSKLLVACLWVAVSFVAAILSIVIISASSWANLGQVFSIIKDAISYFFSMYGTQGMLLILNLLLLAVTGLVASIMQIYCAISIGHLANIRRGLTGIAAYLGLSIIITQMSRLYYFLINAGPTITNWINHMYAQQQFEITQGNIVIFVAAVLQIIIAMSLFGVTTTILKKRLNLE